MALAVASEPIGELLTADEYDALPEGSEGSS